VSRHCQSNEIKHFLINNNQLLCTIHTSLKMPFFKRQEPSGLNTHELAVRACNLVSTPRLNLSWPALQHAGATITYRRQVVACCLPSSPLKAVIVQAIIVQIAPPAQQRSFQRYAADDVSATRLSAASPGARQASCRGPIMPRMTREVLQRPGTEG